MTENQLFMLIVAGVVVVILVGIAVMLARFYRKVDQGKALIINKMQKRKVQDV